MFVASTISKPRKKPPSPSTSGYTARSTTLLLRPNGPRHRTRSAIYTSESTVSAASASIAPRTISAIGPWPSAGVKSTGVRV